MPTTESKASKMISLPEKPILCDKGFEVRLAITIQWVFAAVKCKGKINGGEGLD